MNNYIDILYYTGLAISGVVALGLFAAAVYGVGILVMWVQTKFFELYRQATNRRLHTTIEHGRLKTHRDQIERDRLASEKRLAELSSSLKRFLLQDQAELQALETDTKAKSRGVLTELSQRIAEQMEMSKRREQDLRLEMEAQRKEMAAKEAHAEEKHVALQALNEHLRTSNADLTAQNQGLTQTNAGLHDQVSVLQEQIADLRSHLTSMESTRPINESLMKLAKAQDDLQSRLVGLSALNDMIKNGTPATGT